jgi:MFS family permease
VTPPSAALTTTQSKPTSGVRAIVIVFFVHGLLFASWVAHIPQVKANLGIGLGLLGVALLGAPLGSIVATSATGYLIPRFGSRRVLRTSMAGYCLLGALLGLPKSLVAFVFVYAVWGLFQGTLDVAMNTQAVVVERAQRRPTMSLFHGSWSLGALAGAGIGTVAVALRVPLWSQLLVLGLLSLTALAVVTRGLSSADGGRGHGWDRTPSSSEPGGRWLTATLLVLCAIALADMFCEGTAADWSAVYLRSSLHAMGIIVGLGYTLYALAMVLVRFTGGWLFTRLPQRRVLPCLTALATAGFATGLLVDSAAIMLVGFICLGLGCALVIPTTFSVVGHMDPANPGRGLALVSGVGWIGFVAGPPLIGVIASATSLRSAFIAVPILTALVTILTISTGVFERSVSTPAIPAPRTSSPGSVFDQANAP